MDQREKIELFFESLHAPQSGIFDRQKHGHFLDFSQLKDCHYCEDRHSLLFLPFLQNFISDSTFGHIRNANFLMKIEFKKFVRNINHRAKIVGWNFPLNSLETYIWINNEEYVRQNFFYPGFVKSENPEKKITPSWYQIRILHKIFMLNE